jgi:nitrite reductase/ring-hydroxylating ferredoxin subunit
MSAGEPQTSNSEWHDVCAESELDPEFPLSVEVEGEKVGVFKVGDQVYALEDICPHAYALLSQGFQENGQIECPLHGALFDIATGKSLTEIGQRDLTCHKLKIESSRVWVKLHAA